MKVGLSEEKATTFQGHISDTFLKKLSISYQLITFSLSLSWGVWANPRSSWTKMARVSVEGGIEPLNLPADILQPALPNKKKSYI